MEIKVEFFESRIKISNGNTVYDDMLGNVTCLIAEQEWDAVLEFLDIQRGLDKYSAYAKKLLDKCFAGKEHADKIKGYILCDSEFDLNAKKYTVCKTVCSKKLDGRTEMSVSDIYQIQSVTELINLEVMYAVVNDIAITKCKNCGKYFVANTAGGQYCERLLSSGRTCKQNGAKTLFYQNLKNDEALLLYEKTYQATYYKAKKSTFPEEKIELENKLELLKIYRVKYKRGELSADQFKKFLEKNTD